MPAGTPAPRSASSSLPGGVAVEVEAMFEIG